LITIFRIISGFFRLLFKGVFYKILVKIYYEIFRLKRGGRLNKSALEWLREKFIFLLLLALALILIGGNFAKRSQAAALETKIAQTTMSHLINPEVSNEEKTTLIEEILTPNDLLTAGEEKYENNPCAVNKAGSPAATETPTPSDLLVLNEEGDLIMKPHILTPTGELAPARTEIISYSVQSGDTVTSIAAKFNISVNTILWANNLSAYSLIRPGDTLTILPYTGVLYTVKSGDTLSRIAQLYGVDGDKISSCNDLSGGLKSGQKIIIPGGRKITTTAPAPTYTGISAISNLISPSTAKTSAGKMLWPTVGYRITQYFSWRHPAIDIANKVGTPVYAADDGVVEISQGGWNGGYGNTILINHGGGMKTRYAHASKLLAKVGEEVSQGQAIALMGSTGRSTGPHLHFEVIIKGVRYNPLNYLSY